MCVYIAVGVCLWDCICVCVCLYDCVCVYLHVFVNVDIQDDLKHTNAYTWSLIRSGPKTDACRHIYSHCRIKVIDL